MLLARRLNARQMGSSLKVRLLEKSIKLRESNVLSSLLGTLHLSVRMIEGITCFLDF
jgi:hypothetical protein